MDDRDLTPAGAPAPCWCGSIEGEPIGALYRRCHGCGGAVVARMPAPEHFEVRRDGEDFYGQSYFVDPRGQFVGEVGDPHKEELIVRDLDMDMITEVRQLWQFYRDRRPEMYGDIADTAA